MIPLRGALYTLAELEARYATARVPMKRKISEGRAPLKNRQLEENSTLLPSKSKA